MKIYRYRRLLTVVLLLCSTLLPAGTTQAQRAFDFITDQNNYAVLPNGTVMVFVFLRETLSGNSTSLLLAENGLISAGVQASRTTSPSSPAVFTGATLDITNFDGTNQSSVVAGGAQALLSGTRNPADAGGTPIITDSATIRRILIGSLTIQGGVIPLQTTTFTLGDPSTVSDTRTWTNGTSLDPLIFPRTFTVTVGVVPEPASFALFGLGGLLLVHHLHRRRGKRD